MAKKYKISFGIMMAYSTGTVIAFFYTMDTWGRVDAFNIWAAVSVLAIVCSIVIFKVQSPKTVQNEDVVKLEMLKEAGAISEDQYQKRLSKIENADTNE